MNKYDSCIDALIRAFHEAKENASPVVVANVLKQAYEGEELKAIINEL